MTVEIKELEKYNYLLDRANFNSKAKELIINFGKIPDVKEQHYGNLVKIMSSSPKLIESFNLAAERNLIKSLVILEDNAAGGSFSSSGKLAIGLHNLSTSNTNNVISNEKKYEMIFIMAHETHHALTNKASEENLVKLYEDSKTEAQKGDKHRNFTTVISNYVAFNRRDEAEAQLAGYNAVVSALIEENKNISLATIRNTTKRMLDFIPRKLVHEPKNFHAEYESNLDQSFFLEASPRNIEASAKNYFDKSSKDTRLGCHHNSDYVNRYAGFAIAIAINADLAEKEHNSSNKSPFSIDIQNFKVPRIDNPNEFVNLSLSEAIIESNGLNINADKPIPYIDSSTGNTGFFDKTTCNNTQQNPNLKQSNTQPQANIAAEAETSAVAPQGFSMNSRIKAAVSDGKLSSPDDDPGQDPNGTPSNSGPGMDF